MLRCFARRGRVYRRSQLGVVVAAALIVGGSAVRVQAAEIWVMPTYQQDVGGLGIGSNGFWPVTAVGAVRLAWAVPADLQTFQSAKVVLIPHAPGGNANLNVLICAAKNADLVGAACAGPFAQGFTGVANQLAEVDVSGIVAARVGTAGQTYLAVVAFTTPTTVSDHFVGLRFQYEAALPAGVATLRANTFSGTQTAPAFVGNGSALTNVAPGANTVGSAQVVDGSLTANDLAANSVNGAKIQDFSISAADIDPAQVQRRVTAACNAGNAIRAVNADGTVVCQPTAGARSINLPITAFVNVSSREPIGFAIGSANDAAPDFQILGTEIYLEWDVDGVPDTDAVVTSLVVPPDYASGAMLRLHSVTGAAGDNDWLPQIVRQRPDAGGFGVSSTGGTNCDAGLVAQRLYICTLTLDQTFGVIAAGDMLSIAIRRNGGSNAMRLYSVEFVYTSGS
jgi:hypothetical protein